MGDPLSRHLKLGVMRSQTYQLGSVMADAGLIKCASGWGRSELKGGGGAGPGISALFHDLRRHWRTLVLLVAEGWMSRKNPLSREGNHGGRLPCRLGSDRGARSSRANEAEVRMNGKGAEDSG